MKNRVLITIIFCSILHSCKTERYECERDQEWIIKNFKIERSKCPDLVLAFYYNYKIYESDKLQGSGSLIDSCKIGWQINNENYMIFNLCDEKIRKITSKKIELKYKEIDSVIIKSNHLNQEQKLSDQKIKKFIDNWKKSKPRDYSIKPFDSAFTTFPAYQYKFTVFSKTQKHEFFGYNYILLDESNWKYIMDKNEKLDYLQQYWNK